MTEYELILDLVKTNAVHIGTINAEMGMIAQRISVLETKLDMVFYIVTALAVKSLWEVLNKARNTFNNRKK